MNEDQSKLISSYEKMIEKERIDHHNKMSELIDHNAKVKAEVNDLRTVSLHHNLRIK